jgi:hypothetical protein
MATLHAVKPHVVTVNPAGFYEVTSGRSGKVYRVVPWATGTGADCPCEGYRHRGECGHVDAVIAFAWRELASVAQ